MRTRWLSSCLAALSLALFTGCGEPSEAPSESVTIGLLLPFTGSDSATASNFERAVLFARDQVNAGGGIGGRKLRVISADTHSDLKRAEQSAAELIEAGAVVLIGPESTEVAEHIRPLVDQSDVVLLSPLVGAANDRDVDCETPWFRLAPSARVLGEALAKRMNADGLKRAAVLSADGAYDLALANSFESRLTSPSFGGEVLYRATLARDAQSYARNIERALAQDVDALLLSGTPRTAALVVNELGVLTSDRPQWYLSPLLKTELLLQNVVPEVLEGAIGVTPRIYDASGDFPSAFAERWQGDQPLEGAFFYFDAVALVAFGLEQALRDSGELNAAVIGDAILDAAGPPGEAARWNELPLYLPRMRDGDQIYYTGLTGPMLLKSCGDRQAGASSDWQVQSGKILAVDD